MKPDKGTRQALEALLRDAREEIPDAEVNEMIDRELDKGEGMDADFVLEALRNYDAVSNHSEAEALRKAENWAAIERKLGQPHKQVASLKPRKRWIQAAAAVLVIFGAITIGTVATFALRWDFLIKVFRPFAETLGIHINVEDLHSAGDVEKVEVPEQEQESVSTTIYDFSKVPKTVRGLAAEPTWLPDGYAFKYAEAFDDYNESSLLIVYNNGPTELFVQTIVYGDDVTTTAVNVVEKEGREEAQAANSVTITENNGLVNATLEDGLAYYMVWGRLSQTDIMSVITSIEGAG